MSWALLVLAVGANIAANFMFKIAVAAFPPDLSVVALIKFAFNPYLWVGAACCAVLLSSYLLALREIELMVCYAFVISLSLAGITLVSALVNKTGLGFANVVGVVLITSGILLITVFKPSDGGSEGNASRETAKLGTVERKGTLP